MASSAASENGNASSPAAAVEEIDYVEHHGPGIPQLPAGDPLEEQQLLDGAGEPLSGYPGWEQESVEQFLSGTGHGLHLLIGAGEKDWLMTRTDLDRIAPPLTRILNRYEPSLRASVYADPLLVTHGVALYAWRSTLQRQAALRQRAQERRDGYVDVDIEAAAAGSEAQPGDDDDGGVLDEFEEYTPYAQRRHQ
jgi:hypothetical protein